jgi:hypothetical protein
VDNQARSSQHSSAFRKRGPLVAKSSKCGLCGSLFGNNDQPRSGGELRSRDADNLAKSATDEIASDSAADFLRRDKTHTRRLSVHAFEHPENHHLPMLRHPVRPHSGKLRRLCEACFLRKAQTRRAILGIDRRVVA